jgi:hypothetical protein
MREPHTELKRVSLENMGPERDRKSAFESRDSSAVTAKPSAGADDDHQVLPFRRRNAASSARHGSHWPRGAAPLASPPVKDLAKYEGDGIDDNYRHRMMVNLAALLVTIVLSLTGVWLAIQIADMRKNQDCVLSGMRNCMPIDVKTLAR